MYTYIKSKYWKHWAISLLLMLGIGYAMKNFCCFSVPNLIAIEFAHTAPDLQEMIAPYLKAECNVLNNNTLLDFGFMVGYTLAFYFSGRIICDLLEFRWRKWLFVLLLPFVFDFAENLLLLHSMKNGVSDINFTAFYIAVRLKWLLVIPAFLLLITVALYQLYVGIDKIYCRWIEIGDKN